MNHEVWSKCKWWVMEHKVLVAGAVIVVILLGMMYL